MRVQKGEAICLKSQLVHGPKFSQLRGVEPSHLPTEALQEHRPVSDHRQESSQKKGGSPASRGPQDTFDLLL